VLQPVGLNGQMAGMLAVKDKKVSNIKMSNIVKLHFLLKEKLCFHCGGTTILGQNSEWNAQWKG
jgi:hypothetical protein